MSSGGAFERVCGFLAAGNAMRHARARLCLSGAMALLALTLSSPGGPVVRGLDATGPPAVQPADELANHATIRRDRFGVPHIVADSEEAAAFAHGYVTAEDHGADLALLFLRARGGLASVFGESFVDEDERALALGIHEVAAERFDELPPFMRAVLHGYAAGYNAYLARHRAEFPDWAAPVSGIDVLAHARAVLLLDFALNLKQWDGSSVSNGGSNVWAIGRPLSRSGGGLLLANPHLPWEGSMKFHEVHLRVPGIIDVSGATFIGLPVVVIGFNESLGWSHTVNQVDSDDLYELTLDPTGTKYAYDELWLPLESRTVTIDVKTGQGVEPRTLTLLSSHYGPVARTSTGQFRAFKSANLAAVNFLTQWNGMGKASSLDSFVDAVRMQQLPMFNLAYADRDGNIWYLFNGRIPLRPAGYDWAGVVPGNTSKTEWFVIRPLSDLPQLLNPATGYVQNCNDGPWFTNLTRPIDRARFTGYINSDTLEWRTQFSLRTLSSEHVMTLEKLKAYKFDAEAPFAGAVTDSLVALARTQRSQDLRDAAAVLAVWDRQTNAESRGAVLYMAWFGQYFNGPGTSFRTPWSSAEATRTPSGLADPSRALQALSRAAAAVRQAYGSLDIAWGETHRLRRGSLDLPLRGAGPTFTSVMYRPEPGNKFVAVGGDSYVLAVEFTSTGPRAYSVLAYSQSSKPQSPHFSDQTKLYATQQYKTAWFTERDIAANSISEYRPNR